SVSYDGRHPRCGKRFICVGRSMKKRGCAAPLRFILWTCVSTVLLSLPIASGQTQVQSVATAVSVQGTVDAQTRGATQWHAVKLNEVFGAGDTIRVGERSRADVSLLDQSILRLNENTMLTIQPP